ncbi:hypothetical protein KM1_015860 [Entamoeba histolytica HM-3:IMSS]|uniref:Uncharacterized protein n=1 Tax=Entamoeba histolytica HM-3:IMSS TaxID=885315 RepID=M7VXV0_ENTHI|nr:hypothetical protein KM1_015860 [Entamoeba histolytica HM-3:IMSS]
MKRFTDEEEYEMFSIKLKHVKCNDKSQPLIEEGITLKKREEDIFAFIPFQHYFLKHVTTHDKSKPQIPTHLKKLLSLDHQKLMKQITERRVE